MPLVPRRGHILRRGRRGEGRLQGIGTPAARPRNFTNAAVSIAHLVCVFEGAESRANGRQPSVQGGRVVGFVRGHLRGGAGRSRACLLGLGRSSLLGQLAVCVCVGQRLTRRFVPRRLVARPAGREVVSEINNFFFKLITTNDKIVQGSFPSAHDVISAARGRG